MDTRMMIADDNININHNCGRERSRRPIRNKRYCRRTYGEDKRPPKRLFTPEIKRFLKDWLVRRRENPYPNRDEKKMLAIQTGLTYIQVCNWFANWRRKLKNAGREPQRKTWGDLIKTYNSQVQGNVEHFSICSGDSIWEEVENNASAMNYYNNNNSESNLSSSSSFSIDLMEQNRTCSAKLKNDHSYTYRTRKIDGGNQHKQGYELVQNQCYFVSSTTTENENNNTTDQMMMMNSLFANTTTTTINNNKYKNHIMEKYLRDCHHQKPDDDHDKNDKIKIKEEINNNNNVKSSSMISKWLESAANFQPSESSYLNWTFQKNHQRKNNNKNNNVVQSRKSTENQSCLSDISLYQIHGREELDAAEALTRLANARSFNNNNNKS